MDDDFYGSSKDLSLKLPKLAKIQATNKAKKKDYDIDYVGTGTKTSLHNILQRRNVEPIKKFDAQLSARGLKHRTSEYFEKDVNSTTNFIQNQLRLGMRDTQAGLVSSEALLNVYFQRALGYERLGAVDKAIADYTTCIRLDKEYAPAYHNRASLLDNKGNIDGAAKDLLMAVTLDPANITYRTNRSIILRRKGDYKEAIKETMLCKAMKMHPSSAKEIVMGTNTMLLDSEALTTDQAAPEDLVITLMSLPKDERTDVAPIIDFLKILKFFRGFSDDIVILSRIARCLDINFYEKGDYVFEEGDLGDRFYMVYDGEVSIVKTKKDEKGAITATATLVKIFHGHTFGETALDNKGGKRSAGALASHKTTLFSLHVDDYNSIITTYKTLLRNEIRSVLSVSAAFMSWENDRIDALASIATVQNFSANHVLLKAGEPVKKLYIIKHGVASMMKVVNHPLHFSQMKERPQYSAAGEEKPGLWILDKNWKDRMNTFDKVPIVGDTDKGGGGDVLQSGHHNSDQVPFTVGVLGSGQVFGELAILDPDKPSPVSVVSCTNMELYVFDSDILISLGARFNGVTINVLNESMNMCNPPGDKVCYYFRSKYEWERRKVKLLSGLGHG